MKVIENIAVGRPHTRPAAPAHVKGVAQGNARAGRHRQEGLIRDGFLLRATARRSTGIDPAGSEPIDPRMPVLTPP